MQEYVSKAVVLDVGEQGDLDSRVSLFTERFGKVTAKAKSTRKITSKLSPHLQPGNLVRARFVEKGGLQVVDVLKEGRIKAPFPAITAISSLLHDWQPEEALWPLLLSSRFSWIEVLTVLGWDPRHALCSHCGAHMPSRFDLVRQEFFCEQCAFQTRNGELLCIQEDISQL